MLEVMIDELRAATRDFYNMTGIMIVLYDDSRRVSEGDSQEEI